MWSELLKSFVQLFIIIDPFVSGIFFIGFSKDMDEKEKHRALWTAISVAAGLLFLFLFIGLYLLELLNITFNGFKIAGGILLLIMGVSSVLGIELGSKKENVKSAAILIGTPLLSGPGALTTIIILSKDYGYFIPGLAALLVLTVSFFILHYAERISKFVGTEMIQIFSKVLGLLLAALAVDFIHSGIAGFIGG